MGTFKTGTPFTVTGTSTGSAGIVEVCVSGESITLLVGPSRPVAHKR